MINFEEKDIEFIVTNIVVPCLKEYSEGLAKTNDELDKIQFTSLEKVMDIVSVKFKELEIKNLRNLSFIKAVLFANKLSTDECYKNYIDEWNKLNKDLIEEWKGEKNNNE